MRASIMEHNTGCHKLVAVIASETTDAMSTLSSGNASIQSSDWHADEELACVVYALRRAAHMRCTVEC